MAASRSPTSTSLKNSCFGSGVTQGCATLTLGHAPAGASNSSAALVEVAGAALLRVSGIGYSVHLGVARGPIDGSGNDHSEEGQSKLNAHAWCVAGGGVVTGPGALDRFARVAQFVHDPSRSAR